MPLSIYPISEKAVTIAFNGGISEELMHRIGTFDRLLREHPVDGLQATVPAYNTLRVFPARLSAHVHPQTI